MMRNDSPWPAVLAVAVVIAISACVAVSYASYLAPWSIVG